MINQVDGSKDSVCEFEIEQILIDLQHFMKHFILVIGSALAGSQKPFGQHGYNMSQSTIHKSLTIIIFDCIYFIIVVKQSSLGQISGAHELTLVHFSGLALRDLTQLDVAEVDVAFVEIRTVGVPRKWREELFILNVVIECIHVVFL